MPALQCKILQMRQHVKTTWQIFSTGGNVKALGSARFELEIKEASEQQPMKVFTSSFHRMPPEVFTWPSDLRIKHSCTEM